MSTRVKVRKFGNEMGVLIPEDFARMHRIDVGSVVDIEGIRVVKPRRRRYRLAELMTEFRPWHRHGEWELGKPVGTEVW